METKIHFTVKALCAAFIFYQLWIFIFSRQMYDAWEKVCRMMRIARIKLWKCRKEYRIYREEKAEKPEKRQGVRKRWRKPKWHKRATEQ